MHISVVISTYGMERIEDTHQAINSVLKQTGEKDELIVIIDENDELMEDLERKFGNRIVINTSKTKGLSNARNLGVEVAKGEIVAFIDDDATACEGWIEGIRSALSRGKEIAACTGPILPNWLNNEQEWFPRELNWMISCTYSDIEDGAFVDTAFGTNMAFRKDILLMVGGFHAKLGAVQKWKKINEKWITKTGLVGEERFMCMKVHDAGFKIIYSSNVCVNHKVYIYRVAFKNLLDRAYWEGYSKAYIKKHFPGVGGQTLSTERSYLAELFLNMHKPDDNLGLSDMVRMYATSMAVVATVIIGYFVFRISPG